MSMIERDSNKDIEKIVIKYEDGSEKEIEKGTIITFNSNEESEEITLNFEFADMNKQELLDMIIGVTKMGIELGVFDD